GRETADAIAAAGVRLARCWDVTTVHRLSAGTWHCDPGSIWAWLHDLPATGIPRTGQLDLLSSSDSSGAGDTDDPLQPDGYLRPEWAGGTWAEAPDGPARWARLALEA